MCIRKMILLMWPKPWGLGLCCSPAFHSPVLPRVVRAVTDSCIGAEQTDRDCWVNHCICRWFVYRYRLWFILESYKHSPGFPPSSQRQGPVQASFCYASVLVPVDLRPFWCPSFQKPSNMCLCGYAERLAYAHVIFRSDICLTKRVVSVWGSILGPMVQG